VNVDNRWWIDVVIDGWLAIEFDGEEVHADRFEQDRSRDMELTIRGYRVLRFSYDLVVNHWDRVLDAIRAALTARHCALLQNSGEAAGGR
jgi:very-short-patch-repair endonuclease